jgi:hypothetical protein
MKIAALDKALPNKWLQLALLVTAALTFWAFLQGDEPEAEAEAGVVELADKRSTTVTRDTNINTKQQLTVDAQKGVIAWEKLKRTPLQGRVDNPFRVHSWLIVPPVKKIKPAPPLIPTVPPAPFTYMGKYEESPANTQIFLLANGKLYSTTQGKNIDGQWRLDGEDANNLQLTYLPLNLPQVLSKTARPLPSEIAPAASPVAAEVSL